ncbi:SMI1/KNR4 family protein [Kitasatospora sp. NPDC101183]|uniref:SMI1/KNR4 family protein n=1 Tax=Kitasatospora sp. NPDC101183 TaxID=3364100 RepID=UPI00380F4F44
MSALHAFATWEPLLRLFRAEYADHFAVAAGRVTGEISTTGWSGIGLRDREALSRAAELVQRSLAGSEAPDVRFAADIEPDGRTTLHVFESSSAVTPEYGFSGLGTIRLVDGAVPEPWRRLPGPTPAAVPAPSADPALLERTLRERLPDAVGATEEEIAAAEERLGVTLPEELKAFYRVTRVSPSGLDGSWEDWEAAHAESQEAGDAVGCELGNLEGLFIADAAMRAPRWRSGATEAVRTPPDAVVQGLAGSPGWIGFGTNGGDIFAIDLTPGPRGHLGQVILIDHECSFGAEPYGESLTEMVLNQFERTCRVAEVEEPELPLGVRVGAGFEPADLTAAAHPDLEVVEIFRGGGEPLSLAPIAGLPRVRTLKASPGALADPLEVAALPALEYLAVGTGEWRALLDAGAVPRGLVAASVEAGRDEDVVGVVGVANELLALWGRPLIVHTVVGGEVG